MKYVFGFVRLLASTFLFLLFLLTFLHWCGYDFRVEYNRMEIGLRSSDGKYKYYLSTNKDADENTKFWSFPTKAIDIRPLQSCNAMRKGIWTTSCCL